MPCGARGRQMFVYFVSLLCCSWQGLSKYHDKMLRHAQGSLALAIRQSAPDFFDFFTACFAASHWEKPGVLALTQLQISGLLRADSMTPRFSFSWEILRVSDHHNYCCIIRKTLKCSRKCQIVWLVCPSWQMDIDAEERHESSRHAVAFIISTHLLSAFVSLVIFLTCVRKHRHCHPIQA